MSENCSSFCTDNFGHEYGLCCNDGQRYCEDIENCDHKKLQKAIKRLKVIASLKKRGFKSLINGVQTDFDLDDAIEFAELILKEIE